MYYKSKRSTYGLVHRDVNMGREYWARGRGSAARAAARVVSRPLPRLRLPSP